MEGNASRILMDDDEEMMNRPAVSKDDETNKEKP